MGDYLSKPVVEKHVEEGAGNGLHFGVSCMQGYRKTMEDAHTAKIGIGPGYEDWSFFAVFDGHCGTFAATYSAKHLLDFILQTEDFKKRDYVKAIVNGFINYDAELRRVQSAMKVKAELEEAEKKEKEKHEYRSWNDRRRRRKEEDVKEYESGCAAICVLISPDEIYIGNCGDAKAVIYSGDSDIFSTQDLKPELPAESARIKKAGGHVRDNRVNGQLAMSRALGDFMYKNVKGFGPCEQLVSPEPEVYIRKRNPDKDEFLLLSCDGIYESDALKYLEKTCALVNYRLQITDDLKSVLNFLLDYCLAQDSKDNMSAVLITFPKARKPDKEMIKKEEEFEYFLKKKISDEFHKNPSHPEFEEIKNHIRHQIHHSKFKDYVLNDVEALMHTKYAFMKSFYEKLVKEKEERLRKEEEEFRREEPSKE